MKSFSPRATDMIPADHARVLAAFRRYDIDGSPTFKQALVGAVCHALETVVLPAAESVLGSRLAAAAGLLAGLYLLSRLTHAQR